MFGFIEGLGAEKHGTGALKRRGSCGAIYVVCFFPLHSHKKQATGLACGSRSLHSSLLEAQGLEQT